MWFAYSSPSSAYSCRVGATFTQQLLCISALAVVVSTTASSTATTTTGGFYCQTTWPEPSSDNSFLQCLSSLKHVQHNVSGYILPIMCALYLIGVFFACPVIMVRYCRRNWTPWPTMSTTRDRGSKKSSSSDTPSSPLAPTTSGNEAGRLPASEVRQDDGGLPDATATTSGEHQPRDEAPQRNDINPCLVLHAATSTSAPHDEDDAAIDLPHDDDNVSLASQPHVVSTDADGGDDDARLQQPQQRIIDRRIVCSFEEEDRPTPQQQHIDIDHDINIDIDHDDIDDEGCINCHQFDKTFFDPIALEKRQATRPLRKWLVVVVSVVLIGLWIASLFLMVYGTTRLALGVDLIFLNLNEFIVEFFSRMVSQLHDLVYNSGVVSDVTSGFIEPYSSETFTRVDDTISDVRLAITNVHRTVRRYVVIVAGVSFAVAATPVVLPVASGFGSGCNIRASIFTMGLSWFTWLLAVVCSALACVLFVASTLTDELCSEVNLQKNRQPGVGQWLLVPYCEAETNFTGWTERIRGSEASFARIFCEQMTEYCSGTSYYDAIGDPDRFFVCGTSYATAGSDCSDFETTSEVLSAVYAKEGSPVCAHTRTVSASSSSSSVSLSLPSTTANCSFQNCPSECTDSDVRESSVRALLVLQLSGRLYDALNLTLSYMDCNVILDRVILVLKDCAVLSTGMRWMAVGYFISLSVMLCSWVVFLSGQKLWFSDDEYDEGVARSTGTITAPTTTCTNETTNILENDIRRDSWKYTNVQEMREDLNTGDREVAQHDEPDTPATVLVI